MIQLDAERVRALLDWPSLIEALRRMFREGCEAPMRHHHEVAVPGEPDATLLLMPAWVPGRYLGVKVANVMPGNAARGLPAIHAWYLLFDGRSGEPLALADGGELTARRTAAASALAASLLAREDAKRLLVVGSGRLAPNLAAAHAAVRPYAAIEIWGRRPEAARAVAAALQDAGLPARAAPDLEPAVRRADVVSCATLAAAPVVHGAWLAPGSHLDLVGGFKPNMREADDEAIARSRVYVDTLEGATREAGDIVAPLRSGRLRRDAICGDLYGLCRGEAASRATGAEITLFKSTGTALEDLAAAVTAYERARG